MKRLLNHIAKMLLSVSVAALAVGCLEEDPDLVCTQKVALRLVYELNMDYRDKLLEQLNSFELYVYDQSGGTLLESFAVPVSSLDDKNSLYLTLKPGDYKIVVWGNRTGENIVTDATRYSQMKLRLDADSRGDVNACTSLFHGMTDLKVVRGESARETVFLTKDTKEIRVIFENLNYDGTSRNAPNTPIQVRITGNNGIYNYDNSLSDENSSYGLTYIPVYRPSPVGEMEADFSIMRMFSDDAHRDNLKLTIVDTRTPAGTPPLEEFWLSETIVNTIPHTIDHDEFLDRKDDYEIRIKMRGWTVVEITIDKWTVNENTGGI